MASHSDARPFEAAMGTASSAVASDGALACMGRAPGRQISNAPIPGFVLSGRFIALFAFLRLRGDAAAAVAVPLIGDSATTARGKVEGDNG